MTPVKMLWRVRGGDFSKMELDVAFDPGDEGQPRVSLLDLPEEIQLKILHLLQPLDILALGRTCRSYSKYADNKQLWYDSKFSIAKHLILCAGVASGFFWARRCLDSRFPRSQALSSWAFSSRYESNSALFFFLFREFSNLKILFSEKDCCRRIWTILSADGGLYPKCIHCRLFFKF